MQFRNTSKLIFQELYFIPRLLFHRNVTVLRSTRKQQQLASSCLCSVGCCEITVCVKEPGNPPGQHLPELCMSRQQDFMHQVGQQHLAELHLPKQYQTISDTVHRRNTALCWTPPAQTIPDYRWHCGQEKHSFVLNPTCQNNTVLLALLWTRETWLCAELHLPKHNRNVSVTVDKRNRAMCWTPPAQTIQDYQHHCGQEKHSFVRNSICPNTTGMSVSLWTRETGLCVELHLPKQYKTISITVDKRNTALCWTPPAQTIQDYQHHCGQEKHSFVLNSTCPNNTRLSASLWTRKT